MERERVKGLTLERKVGEGIRIGADVIVWLSSIREGGRAKLTIDAPRSTPIVRLELEDRHETTR